MILKVYTLFDSKAGAYLQPFYKPSKGLAIRAMQDMLSDPQTQFSKYPSDFTLFEVAEFNDESGMLKSHDSFINLGTLLEHKSSLTQ